MKPGIPFAVALVLSFGIAACAPQRAPLALNTTVSGAEIDEVLVLPVIDARPTTYEHSQVARNVGDAMVRFLRERGYFTISADGYNVRPNGPLDLHVATAEQLIPLSPEDARYFVLVQVERLEPGTNVNPRFEPGGETNSRPEPTTDVNAVTWDARLSAVMVDRPGGRVVWRDVATASSTLDGALTVFSRGSVQYEAAVNASRLLVQTLPDKRPGK